ncbi:FlxA-like family protein [Paenibacillus agilis]|uniref:FlxA-like family protein n=1 Tax=Paenibacillus agilis TaxID=3020863 RepID=A0A559IGL7_9BACL|nr:FlxA-like family protein [Paenibacillus agilis]TVX86817.1 hypothetical protein FPZ44_23150 [Paenibacillus agilis]
MTRIDNFSSKSSYRTNTLSMADREIQALVRQKNNIHEQIAEVKADQELDDKLKTQRVETLTTQLQTIEAQMTQIRMEQAEKRKEGASSSFPQSKSSNEVNMEPSSTPAMEHLIEVGSLYNSLGQLTGVRTKLHGEATNLKGEVRLGRLQMKGGEAGEEAATRSEMRANAEMTIFKQKTEEALEVESKIRSLDQKISKTMADIQEALQENGDKNTEQNNQMDNYQVGGTEQAQLLDQSNSSTKKKENNISHEQDSAKGSLDIRI